MSHEENRFRGINKIAGFVYLNNFAIRNITVKNANISGARNKFTVTLVHYSSCVRFTSCTEQLKLI